MVRYHLDQHVDSAIARGLRLRGIDVTTTAEAGLQHASDQEHLAYATANQRVVVTFDRDFLRFHAAGVDHPGMVYCQQGSRSIGEIVRFLEFLSECLEPKDMARQVEYI